MKLLHVIGSMDPRSGGPYQGVHSLALWHLENKKAIEVVCLDDPNSEYLSQSPFQIHALGQGRGPWHYHSALSSWLKKNLPRFDAAILNGLWQYPGYALFKAAQQPNMPPYFVFPHGMLDPWFQRAPGRRLKAIRNWFFWKLIEQRVVRNAEALFFTSAEEIRLARETFRPYQPKREINVGYGVTRPPKYDMAMKLFFMEKCPGVNGKPYYLFFSRIHPKKGIDLLIKAYSVICGPISNARRLSLPNLIIAGPGLETSYGQSMQKLASDLCPPNSVFWPGMLTGDAKWGALYNCEAFILPSHQENFGIAVVETLACGRPVLISDQVNIWREIKEDKAGLIGPDTVAGTERLFREWEKLSPADKIAMGHAAKSSYENRFNIISTAQKLTTAVADLTMYPNEKTVPNPARV